MLVSRLLPKSVRPSAAPRPADVKEPSVYRRHQFRLVLIFGLLVAVVVPPLGLSTVDQGLVNLWLVYSILAVGFYFIFALGGQFALSQAFMALLGGFVAAYVSGHSSFLVGVIAGMAVTAVVAFAFAFLMRRVNGFYFAIATLGLAEIGSILLRNSEAIGGRGGTKIGIESPTILGWTMRTGDEVFWLILLTLVLTLLAAAALERSPVRREVLAANHNAQVSETLGIPVTLLRLSVFTFGSMLAALAGAVYAHWQGYMSIEGFGLDLGIGIFIMVLFGGTSSVWGSLIGAAFYVSVLSKLEGLGGFQDVFFGAAIIVIIVGFPDGLIGILRTAVAYSKRLLDRRKQRQVTS